MLVTIEEVHEASRESASYHQIEEEGAVLALLPTAYASSVQIEVIPLRVILYGSMYISHSFFCSFFQNNQKLCSRFSSI